jgi:pimeloyl-ACP methyl ester carboxylesterase
LEYDWNSPVWRHWLEGLSKHHTLVRYDQRGCGLSDWDIADFSIEAEVQDLETVVGALSLSRFSLLGSSQSGPVAISYAVRHPEKVSHLILYGSYARGFLKINPTPEKFTEAEMHLNLIKLGWGRDNPAFRQVFSTKFLPEGTPEQISWFNDLQRISTSPENAVKRDRLGFNVDVTDLARQVTVPTLVIHARNDAAVAFERGRQLAALIPKARLVSLESKNHILLANEPAWPQFLAEVYRFLGTESTQ